MAVLAAASGCGYHTAGSAVQLPENVKTIAVPAFTNVTTTYRIEQMLTTSVVHEFTTRTHYHIMNEPGEAADATLTGRGQVRAFRMEGQTPVSGRRQDETARGRVP